jgi:hypothetical protein
VYRASLRAACPVTQETECRRREILLFKQNTTNWHPICFTSSREQPFRRSPDSGATQAPERDEVYVNKKLFIEILIMFNLTDTIKIILDQCNLSKQKENQYEILKYAILSEAKINNDLSTIICKAGITNIIKQHPELFNQFTTYTGDILLGLGIPAYKIFNEEKLPNEEEINNMYTYSFEFLQKKDSAELYEFYIRKCNLIKSLCLAKSLNIKRISLYKRCKHIEHGTKILISRINK